jgi:hypothetical protein
MLSYHRLFSVAAAADDSINSDKNLVCRVTMEISSTPSTMEFIMEKKNTSKLKFRFELFKEN